MNRTKEFGQRIVEVWRELVEYLNTLTKEATAEPTDQSATTQMASRP